MPYTADDAAALSNELDQALRATGDDPTRRPNERLSGIEIVSRLADDPGLRLHDILPPEDGPPPPPIPTLSGRDEAGREAPGEHSARARDYIFNVLRGIGDPFGFVPAPPPRSEVRDVQSLTGRDQGLRARQGVDFPDVPEARVVGGVLAGGPAIRGAERLIGAVAPPVGRAVGRVTAPVAEHVAAHPAAYTLGGAGATMLAAPASTQEQPPVTGLERAQRSLATLEEQRNRATARQDRITADLEQWTRINPNDANAVRGLQEFLAAQGFDPRTRDGQMGTKTIRALNEWRTAMGRQSDQISADLNTLAPQLKGAQDEVTAARRADQVEVGNRRLTEIENNAGFWERALRNYGPGLGYALGGFVAGPALRYGVTRYRGEGAAARADDIMARTVASNDVPGRVGRVNEFSVLGQSPMFGPRQAPFARDTSAGSGYRANDRAPEASALFQPNRAREQLENTGIAAGMTGEWATMQFYMIPRAQEEVRQARAALAADPSNEANIRRLQAAINLEAAYQMAGNIGLPAILGYTGASHFMPRGHVRPSTAAFEAEQMRLDRLLNRDTGGRTSAAVTEAAPRARPAPGSAPPEGSVWNETAQRWMGPAVPGRPGRPFLHGEYAPPAGRRTRSE